MNSLRFPDKKVGQFPMAYIQRKAGTNLSETGVMDFIAKLVSLKADNNTIKHVGEMVGVSPTLTKDLEFES